MIQGCCALKELGQWYSHNEKNGIVSGEDTREFVCGKKVISSPLCSLCCGIFGCEEILVPFVVYF